MEVLEDGLAELIRHIEALAVKSEDPTVDAEGKLIFEYIHQNSDLFQILLKSQSVARIRKSVVKNISTIFQNSCRPLRRSNSQIPASIAGNHIATSLLALIEWWLENKISPPPAQMGKIYKALIIDATISAVASR
jgi:hypothetical protein